MDSENQETPTTWVKFEEENEGANKSEYKGAVINAETTEVNLEKAKVDSVERSPAVIPAESVQITIPRSKTPASENRANSQPQKSSTLRSVDLHDNANGRTAAHTQVGNAVVRQGFGETLYCSSLMCRNHWVFLFFYCS